MKVFTLRFASEMYEELKAIAKKRSYTVTQLIKQILWEWIEKHRDNETA